MRFLTYRTRHTYLDIIVNESALMNVREGLEQLFRNLQALRLGVWRSLVKITATAVFRFEHDRMVRVLNVEYIRQTGMFQFANDLELFVKFLDKTPGEAAQANRFQGVLFTTLRSHLDVPDTVGAQLLDDLNFIVDSHRTIYLWCRTRSLRLDDSIFRKGEARTHGESSVDKRK